MSVSFISQADIDVTGDSVLALNQQPEAGRAFDLQYEATTDLNAAFAAYLYENTSDGRHNVAYKAGSSDDSVMDAMFASVLGNCTLAFVDGTQKDEGNATAAAEGTGGGAGAAALALTAKDEDKIMKDVGGVAFFSSWRAQNFTPASVTAARTANATPLSSAMAADARTSIGNEEPSSTGSWIAQIMREAHSSTDGTSTDATNAQSGRTESDADIVGRTIAETADSGDQENSKYHLRLEAGDALYFRWVLDYSGKSVASVASDATGAGAAANAQAARTTTVFVSLKVTQA